jgi:L-rhamnose mutarotase
MARVAFLLRVREGSEMEYRLFHNKENLWPSIIEACQKAGLQNYTGFIGGSDGRTVFATFESDDPAISLTKLQDDPANAEWQEHMAPLMESSTSFESEGVGFLEEVFHID